MKETHAKVKLYRLDGSDGPAVDRHVRERRLLELRFRIPIHRRGGAMVSQPVATGYISARKAQLLSGPATADAKERPVHLRKNCIVLQLPVPWRVRSEVQKDLVLDEGIKSSATTDAITISARLV